MSKKLVGVIVAAVIAVVGVSASAAGQGQEKVLVCHNDGKVTIEVAMPAVQVHLAHGDSLGACEDGGGDPI